VKKLISVVLFIAFILSVENTFALNTLYENRQGYENQQGYDNSFSYEVYQNQIYNNNIPYKDFFKNSPEHLKVQSVDSFGNTTQAVIEVNQNEQKIEQEGIK
jgi:hypothetical protein